MGGSSCVRTRFLSSGVSASAPNAHSERDDFEEENGASALELKACLEEAANDGTMDSIIASMSRSFSRTHLRNRRRGLTRSKRILPSDVTDAVCDGDDVAFRRHDSERLCG